MARNKEISIFRKVRETAGKGVITQVITTDHIDKGREIRGLEIGEEWDLVPKLFEWYDFGYTLIQVEVMYSGLKTIHFYNISELVNKKWEIIL